MSSTRTNPARFANSLDSGGNDSQHADADLCFQNIGPAGRRQRFGFGVVMLGLTLTLAAVLLLLRIPRGWRLGLFFPFTISAIGFAQARAKT